MVGATLAVALASTWPEEAGETAGPTGEGKPLSRVPATGSTGCKSSLISRLCRPIGDVHALSVPQTGAIYQDFFGQVACFSSFLVILNAPILNLRRNSSGIPSMPPVAAHKRKREKAGTAASPRAIADLKAARVCRTQAGQRAQ
jgi:hypothetical protein